jgi:hypothetical protein
VQLVEKEASERLIMDVFTDELLVLPVMGGGCVQQHSG